MTGSAAALVLLSLAAASARPLPASLCRPDEAVVFACPVGGKALSVCAGKSWVQYRFGRPGVRPELRLPDPAGPPASVASGAPLTFSGGGGAWLRFVNGPYSYTVYSAIGRWGAGGAPAEKAGVLVEKSGIRVSHVRCTGGDTGVDAGWMEAVGVMPDARGFDLP